MAAETTSAGWLRSQLLTAPIWVVRCEFSLQAEFEHERCGIDRLRMVLVRQGVTYDSSLSSSSKDEGQQELLGTQIGEWGP